MDLHHLKIFYVSAREKSFTNAAKKLFISQSAVSVQVRKLEQALGGIQLIERNSKNFKLTYVGKELYKMCQEIFEKVYRMENDIKKIIDLNKNKIVIGATHSIGEPLLPSLIEDYKKLNPEIEFDIYIKNKESLINLLKEGDVDIILLNTDYLSKTEFHSIDSDDFPFVIVAPKHVNNIKELKNMYFLKREDENTDIYMSEFDKILDSTKLKTMSINGSIETIKNCIKKNMGFSVLPYYCVHNEIVNEELKKIKKLDVDTKLKIALLKQNKDKPWLTKFIRFLKEYDIK